MEESKSNNNQQNTTQEQELESYFDQKEQRYVGSLLFWLHLLFAFGMLWVGAGLNEPVVWTAIMIYYGIFVSSAVIHKKGNTARAIFLTVGSLFLGAFLLLASCFALLSGMYR